MVALSLVEGGLLIRQRFGTLDPHCFLSVARSRVDAQHFSGIEGILGERWEVNGDSSLVLGRAVLGYNLMSARVLQGV